MLIRIIHSIMPRKKRQLSDSEIEHLKDMIANKIPVLAQCKELSMGVDTYKRILEELQQKGVINASGKKMTLGTGSAKKTETEEGKDENADPLVRPTTNKFITLASSNLSEDMVRELEDRLKGAQALKDAEMLYRKNIEAMGFDWNDWVNTALETYYELTGQWYAMEAKKVTPERVMEDATEIATMREFTRAM